MSRTLQLISLALLLAVAHLAAAQDSTTLDGEPALRFFIGHGHLTSYCDGVLWVTATRLRFQALTQPGHAFDHPRSSVTEFKTARSLGFDYVRMEASGHTYRMGVHPTIGDRFGNRFEFLVRAIHDFAGARAEVERADQQRAADTALVTLDRASGSPVLRFAVFARRGYVWMYGIQKAAIFEAPELGDRGYGGSGAASWGWLAVSSDHLSFRSERGPELSLDLPKSDLQVVAGAGGYPRILLRDRNQNWIAFVAGQYGESMQRKGQEVGARGKFQDAALLLSALGTGFPELVRRLLPQPTLAVASQPPGTEVYVNEQYKGTTGPDGRLQLGALEPGEHRVKLRRQGYEEWSQVLRVEPGDEKRLEASLVALPPPPPPKPAGPTPFTSQDVVDLLLGGVSSKRVATLVQERGVDFALTDEVEKRVRAAGGDSDLLVVIAKAKK